MYLRGVSVFVYQPSRSRSDYSQSDVEVKAPVGYVPNATNGVESTVSAEAYRRRHEISVTVSIHISHADDCCFFVCFKCFCLNSIRTIGIPYIYSTISSP